MFQRFSRISEFKKVLEMRSWSHLSRDYASRKVPGSRYQLGLSDSSTKRQFRTAVEKR